MTAHQKIVIAHRSASGYLPEHSLPAKAMAHANNADYIEQRLESIFKQSYPIYEVIILDDSSTDNSVDVIQKYLYRQEFPAKLIVNKANSGSVFKQWEKGVELATGDLIWMAEADDLATPDFLKKLADLFIKEQELVLAYSQSKQIDQDGKLLSNDYLQYTADLGTYWDQDYIVEGQVEIKRGLCVKNTIPNVSGALINRVAFKKSIENLKGHVHLLLLVGGDKHEKLVEEVLPDVFILMSLHGSLDLNSEGANLVHIGDWHSLIETLKGLQDEFLNIESGLVGESLPKVVVVVGVGNILRVNSLNRDVSSEDD